MAVDANGSPAARSASSCRLGDLGGELAAHGLILRGGFHPGPDEPLLSGVGTLLLVGNAGPAMWEAFAPHAAAAADPLDRWTKAVIEPIAAGFGAQAFYPFGTPGWPFQRWATRSETVFRSPLGILIHPEFGLWHAYRAALGFAERMALPPRQSATRPCDACADKPCLGACPVEAFGGAVYDVSACAHHLQLTNADGERGAACHARGCLARNACPIGAKWRYPPEQLRFHMAAFARSVAAAC
jgi:hypothetical protein